MNYSTYIFTILTPLLLGDSKAQSEGEPLAKALADILEEVGQSVNERIAEFRSEAVAPERAFEFEHQLQDLLREAGRKITGVVYNRLESAAASSAGHVWFEAGLYTRLNKKTPQNAWTLFGQIRLWRVGYRPTDKSGDRCIFPLAQALGLIEGASPALAERAAALMGEGGMTQRTVLQRLRQDHGVSWGVKKLREVTAFVSAEMAGQRHETQVEKLLEMLHEATASKGRHKPVLSVGRDGITLGLRCQGGSVYEVATCGTVTVLDRRGRRVGTVYLAWVPEFGQGTMSKQLTELLTEVLRRWQGTLPRLCYVTDAGDNETSYYDKVLSRMKHPHTGKALEWLRVLDYYHASERLWTMGELLYGKGKRATAWVRKMQKRLLKPGGVNRVLHSAAALRNLHGLSGNKLVDFNRAYRYLRKRIKHMRYSEYRRLGVPLGSGVTEAACKTVYTQRLKLSGMRWQRDGAQVILNLRVLRLSGVWDHAYRRVMKAIPQPQVRVQAAQAKNTAKKAA